MTTLTEPGAGASDPRLWLLLSPALPVGGYSYSQALEHAVHAGWVTSFDAARDWILTLAQEVLPRLDLPLLIRVLRSAQENDEAGISHCNDLLLACRETAELLAEDQNMGRALARLGRSLGAPLTALPENPAFAVSFALLCQQWQIDIQSACRGYAWIWCENQVAAAVKLVPLGQTQGQQILLQMTQLLDPISTAAFACEDDCIGMTVPGLAIASAAHETQYSRQFRS